MATAKQRVHHDIPLPEEGVIRIAILSDTHSLAHPEAAAHVARFSPNLILHAGDIGKHEVLDPFAEIAPLHYVRGNIDASNAGPDIVTLTIADNAGYELRIVMTHIALYGPRLRKDARLQAQNHQAHLLVCGHSHVPFIGEQSGIILFNPGSIGPRRPPLPICYGEMILGPGQSSLRHIDCETGDAWLPPQL